MVAFLTCFDVSKKLDALSSLNSSRDLLTACLCSGGRLSRTGVTIQTTYPHSCGQTGLSLCPEWPKRTSLHRSACQQLKSGQYRRGDCPCHHHDNQPGNHSHPHIHPHPRASSTKKAISHPIPIPAGDAHGGCRSRLRPQKMHRQVPHLASDVAEIAQYIRQLQVIHSKAERQQRITAEWRAVGVLLDRVFFLLYFFGIILSIVFFFPKSGDEVNEESYTNLA
ncbi:unnamed protein product [Protopolystoma xenopodis]|uniref:Neurotransmitter-gated ion-channel transmembrane domain-containing protein n=1 Tax=Protopolystoma xenopodis TaxID=117903 RepID=A0A3S5BV98_9PLAT|nr:unnamed protein product [Protopolystoma xenopodis]